MGLNNVRGRKLLLGQGCNWAGSNAGQRVGRVTRGLGFRAAGLRRRVGSGIRVRRSSARFPASLEVRWLAGDLLLRRVWRCGEEAPSRVLEQKEEGKRDLGSSRWFAIGAGAWRRGRTRLEERSFWRLMVARSKEEQKKIATSFTAETGRGGARRRRRKRERFVAGQRRMWWWIQRIPAKEEIGDGEEANRRR